ncbi:MAG: DUF3578 domain-containing protein [Algoriphagus sp.]|uniref:McrB family protein n=1 Tax=Algoriphagus sp. TaxID=1872435 RepID=UPI0026201F9D|nr:DUF3578 domain-containing protein [Algoriphagus sp.]MDG1278521.1 DUF3578 domain-containing protein [Algoriphagus sp.]
MEISFSKDELIQAIQKIDQNPELKKGRHSSTYDLIYEEKNYPPILVLSIANQIKEGKDLTLEDFGNSVEIPFNLLKKAGFEIETKIKEGDTILKSEKTMGYYDELIKFLNQSKTEDLKTRDYKREYKGLKVKVSFGQGSQAKIPWISFLKSPHTTADGIYPVYLFYKDEDLLILAHGVSETHIPNQTWNLQGIKTINELFEEKNLKPPYRYGDSYVFQAYDINSFPEKNKIENDLNEIIEKYSKLISSTPDPIDHHGDDFDSKHIIADISNAGLIFDYILINRCISSLITKPFLILTGLSGSGKTKLAQAFVKWVCETNNQYKVVPVGADWTNREPLLGYPNALNMEEYVKPDNGVLALLITATENPELPYFLILDEMNLSHVERYFADFLSAMESNEEISLHKESKSISGVPSSIKFPKNLFIIGTVNIDETTHMFSPKVLDRANTLEFRIDASEMNHFLDNIGEVNMEALISKGAGMAKSFVQLSLDKSPLKEDLDKINPELARFFVELKKAGAEFGYRSATEILRLIKNLSVIDSTLTLNQKLDIAIIQKLLPKLHGSRNKLNKVLVKLAPLCLVGDFKIETEVLNKEDFDFNSDQVKYPLSLEKIARMYRSAIENGFASFAEA